MRIMIESTNCTTFIDGIESRVWEGTTENNVRCIVFVRRIAVERMEDHAEFDRELRETLPPAELVPVGRILG